MKKAIFYLIDDESTLIDSTLMPHEKLACKAVISNWEKGYRMLISCENQQQAEKIDEYLWQQDSDHFIPHNLVGEGMKNGSPIEIAWVGKRSNNRYHLLINLQESFPEFSSIYKEIIDFVPFDPELKALARQRYIAYKNLGFNLKTIPITQFSF